METVYRQAGSIRILTLEMAHLLRHKMTQIRCHILRNSDFRYLSHAPNVAKPGIIFGLSLSDDFEFLVRFGSGLKLKV